MRLVASRVRLPTTFAHVRFTGRLRIAETNRFPSAIGCRSSGQARAEVEFVSIRVNNAKISDSALEVLRRRLGFYTSARNLRIYSVHVLDIEKNQTANLAISRVLR